jgi:hypothetical protein
MTPKIGNRFSVVAGVMAAARRYDNSTVDEAFLRGVA